MGKSIEELINEAKNKKSLVSMNTEVSSIRQDAGVDTINLQDIEDGMISTSDTDIYDICTYCGNTGKGLKGENPCPRCHRKYVIQTLPTEDYPTSVRVPERYKGNDWSKEKAEANEQLKYLGQNIRKNYPSWLIMLENILQKAKNNTMFRDSYLISGPNGLGKTIWAFTLIKYLYRNSVLVSPILMLNEVDVSSNDFCKYKVLILSVNKFKFDTNIDKLDYILQKRKLLDLPTVVISSVAYSYFVSPVDGNLIYFDEKIVLY